MRAFCMEIPTKIYFGRKTWRQALEKEKSILGGRVLVVTTGGSLRRLGYIEELETMLKGLEEEVCFYDKVSPNPELAEIKEAVTLGKECGAASVIGFGGGSAIDAAKAAAAGLVCGEPIDSYYFNGNEPEASLPVIAIPTTAGTGSELSKGAIISDAKSQLKKGIRGTNLYPKAAIVDSYFTEHIPFKVTMETGFDVFAHAIESFISVKASQFSEMLSLEAVRLTGDNLRRLMDNLDDIKARENMSYASMIMGINLGNTGTALPHRLQYPVGAVTGTGHGAGLLALYPAWLGIEYKHSAGKMDRVASILSGKDCHGEEESLGEFMKFIEKLSVRQNLKDLGINEDMIGCLAQRVSGNMKNDPAFREADVIQKIYRQSYQA